MSRYKKDMKKFKKVYIEISNICNLSCSFCPETRRKKEVMDLARFSHILDEIEPYTDYIYLHIKGEPLLHQELDSILNISEQKGFKVNITTNGTLINNVQDKLLDKKALRQINFSLHSFEGEFNENVKYFGDIFDYIKLIKDSSIIISLRLWNLDEDNVNKARNRKLLELIEKEFSLDYKIEDLVLSGRGYKIANNVYLNQDYEFKWPDLQEEEDDGIGFCHGLRDHVGILVDGTVIPCCLDGEGVINLGNIDNNNFRDIINSRRARQIYDGFSKRIAIEELCRKCGFRRKFTIK